LKPGTLIKIAACFTGMCFYTVSPADCQDSTGLVRSPSINKAKLFTTIGFEAAVCTAGVIYLDQAWYKGYSRVPFHFHNDNAAYLQCDKAGHAFATYAESYISYKLLRNAGVKKGPALLYGGTFGMIFQTPIEIFDGLYDRWGCSWGDMVANTSGWLFFMGQELLLDDQVMKFKWSSINSSNPVNADGSLPKNFLEKFLFDYNGHTYWLSMPVGKIIPGRTIPPWLCLSAGYGANGLCGKLDNPPPYQDITRYRQFLFSLDIDWTKIKTSSKLLKAVLNCMVFIKLPFPTLEFNSLGKVRGYWLYY
jgi:hypothetical protein